MVFYVLLTVVFIFGTTPTALLNTIREDFFDKKDCKDMKNQKGCGDDSDAWYNNLGPLTYFLNTF